MLWQAYHNSEINWKTREVKIIRCLEKCGKQQGLKQGKPGQQRQKEGEKEEKKGRRENQKEENNGGEKSGRRMGDL